MKVVVSTTFDDKYLFFLPIITWCWNKLEVDVICFAPNARAEDINFLNLIARCNLGDRNQIYFFKCPEHKEATYAQCSRLYAAALDLPEDEVLITSDVDMAVFKLPYHENNAEFTIVGYDLVPEKQVAMCYLSATVGNWRSAFGLNYISHDNPNSLFTRIKKTYREALDELLSEIECDNFRGNYWCKDQEEAYKKIFNDGNGKPTTRCYVPRAKTGTQIATKRYDRDDAFLLDRLSPDTIDYHLPRPGYEEKNFQQILTVLKYHYPQEDFTWLTDYRNEYLKLL